MRQYRELLSEVRHRGHDRDDRTNTGTRSMFGAQLRFPLAYGFPLVTSKAMPFRLIAVELLWFLSGDTNVKSLQESRCHIWDEWADENGDLGPVYGKQWRDWATLGNRRWDGDGYEIADVGTVDQIRCVQHDLRDNPDSRRIIVSAWNPGDLPDEGMSPQENVAAGRMALAPCHAFVHFYSREASAAERMHYQERIDGGAWARSGGEASSRLQELGWETEAVHDELDRLGVPRRMLFCQLYQRSADMFLGVPFNIASYALLTHMMAQATGHMVGEFIHTFGDVHVYRNHFEQVNRLLALPTYPLPTLRLDPAPRDIDDFRLEHFELANRRQGPRIEAPVAI